MLNFLAIVVPFQKRINEQASTFQESVEKTNVLADFSMFLRTGTYKTPPGSDGKNIPLPRNCYVIWKRCGDFAKYLDGISQEIPCRDCRARMADRGTAVSLEEQEAATKKLQ